MIFYALKRTGKYLQTITPNENYSLGKAPTMGNAHCYSEYKTCWGDEIVKFEPFTLASYLKVLLEEYRWKEKDAENIEIIPYK